MPENGIEGVRSEILNILKSSSDSLSRAQIEDRLSHRIKKRALQAHLSALVSDGSLIVEGLNRSRRYASSSRRPSHNAQVAKPERTSSIHLSPDSREMLDYLHLPLSDRKPVGYNHQFLDRYVPNSTQYLSDMERTHLQELGDRNFSGEVAGTYAKQLLSRLLIDLSWNSSRLEGNTYSLLDTRRLLEFGEMAEGRDRLEAQMLLNHKDAIEFLVNTAEEINFNRFTILNLHAILASNLLPHEAGGRLRTEKVGISGSTFLPLQIPQLIDEYFNQFLDTASAITNPFEQAIFTMVQLPYLQPFDDVNKRVSRLAANIPLVKANQAPLSFIDVPTSIYAEALIGVYELNKVSLIKDLFIYAYERSSSQYHAVKQSLGEPDPFRFKHVERMKLLVSEVIRAKMSRPKALSYISEWTNLNIQADEREKFRESVETEVLNVHVGNFARYRVTPSEFSAWQAVWNEPDRMGRFIETK